MFFIRIFIIQLVVLFNVESILLSTRGVSSYHQICYHSSMMAHSQESQRSCSTYGINHNNRNRISTITNMYGITNRKSHRNKLSMMFNPAIAGGLLSGGLHAISGPDHLAALLPPSLGKSGWFGIRLGAIWGLGHGLSAMIIGASAYFLKDQMTAQFAIMKKLAVFAEVAVGLSLLLIGLLGIKENRAIEAEAAAEAASVAANSNSNSTDSDKPLKTSDESNDDANKKENGRFGSKKAIFMNGVLHGFSLDGVPCLAPALAMNTWPTALSFLFSYCIGTMVAMSVTAGLVGEGSVRLGKVVDNPNLPRILSYVSSIIAMLIGVFWIVQAIFLK